MNILPPDVAEDMKWCAWRASWHCSNTRKGYKGDAETDKVAFNDYADGFKKKAAGILSPQTCDHIKWMFWDAAWHTANTRWNYKRDATKDKERMEEHYRSIISSKEMSEELASNVKGMGWFAAWHCANTRVGYKEDAKGDKAKFESYSRKITGEVELVAMKFFMDTAKILKETKPLTIAEQTLVNNVDVEQTMSFSFSVTEGKTKSTSTQIGFKYGVKVGFEAGFFGFAGSKYEVSFEFSHTHSFSESVNTGKTKQYSFPLRVPPHSTYVAKALVQEADMEVPYEMVFDFGGVRKSVYGTWQGVAVSKATYEISKQ